MERPNFKGKGNHSVSQLEDLCERFDEYCSEQQIIKQELVGALHYAKNNLGSQLQRPPYEHVGKKIEQAISVAQPPIQPRKS